MLKQQLGNFGELALLQCAILVRVKQLEDGLGPCRMVLAKRFDVVGRSSRGRRFLQMNPAFVSGGGRLGLRPSWF